MSLAARMQRRWAEAEAEYHAKILASLEPAPDALLLDVGCDDGAWTDEVRRRLRVPPRQVHGLEVVDERAALARARGFDVETFDVEGSWPLEDASFDVVHANQVIEHVVRLDHFVREIRRVLKPDGVAVVCTENLASWHNVGALVLGYQPFSLTNISSVRSIGNRFALHAAEAPRADESWQHVHVLTLVGLRDIFSAHGFGAIESWGTGYYPFPRRVARALAVRDPRHAHFIAVVARPASGGRAGRDGRRRPPDGS